MKVVFKQLKCGGGDDVLIPNLVKSLNKFEVKAQVEFYPHFFQAFPQLLKYMGGAKRCDLMHSPTWIGYGFKEKDVPLVTTENQVFVYDPLFLKYRTPLQRLFYGLFQRNIGKTLEAADAVICVSEYVKSLIEKVYGRSDCVRIYNGIDPDLFKPMPVIREAFG